MGVTFQSRVDALSGDSRERHEYPPVAFRFPVTWFSLTQQTAPAQAQPSDKSPAAIAGPVQPAALIGEPPAPPPALLPVEEPTSENPRRRLRAGWARQVLRRAGFFENAPEEARTVPAGISVPPVPAELPSTEPLSAPAPRAQAAAAGLSADAAQQVAPGGLKTAPMEPPVEHARRAPAEPFPPPPASQAAESGLQEPPSAESPAEALRTEPQTQDAGSLPIPAPARQLAGRIAAVQTSSQESGGSAAPSSTPRWQMTVPRRERPETRSVPVPLPVRVSAARQAAAEPEPQQRKTDSFLPGFLRPRANGSRTANFLARMGIRISP